RLEHPTAPGAAQTVSPTSLPDSPRGSPRGLFSLCRTPPRPPTPSSAWGLPVFSQRHSTGGRSEPRSNHRRRASMRYRVLPLVLAALALAVFAGSPWAGEKGPKNSHVGKFVSADPDGKSFTMTDKKGASEHTHMLAPGAKVLIDGREGRLKDLKKDQLSRAYTKEGDRGTATKVETYKGAAGTDKKGTTDRKEIRDK